MHANKKSLHVSIGLGVYEMLIFARAVEEQIETRWMRDCARITDIDEAYHRYPKGYEHIIQPAKPHRYLIETLLLPSRRLCTSMILLLGGVGAGR
jgi:hypothetical protein